jgi:hypothetical protein
LKRASTVPEQFKVQFVFYNGFWQTPTLYADPVTDPDALFVPLMTTNQKMGGVKIEVGMNLDKLVGYLRSKTV